MARRIYISMTIGQQGAGTDGGLSAPEASINGSKKNTQTTQTGPVQSKGFEITTNTTPIMFVIFSLAEGIT